jgi:signal transduction histidine kinase
VDGSAAGLAPARRERPRLALTQAQARDAARLLAISIGLGAAYVLLAWPTFWYQAYPGGAVAFWAPAGLTLATLALTPRRTWPLWLAAFAAAEFAGDVAHHQGVALSLGNAVANVAEPLVGALLLQRALRGRGRVGELGSLARFTAYGVAAGPLVGATVGATAVALFAAHRSSWWDIAGTWWLGDALGVLVVGSVILSWARPALDDHQARFVTTAAIAILAAGAVVTTAIIWHAPFILLALPALVWAAFAGGHRAVTFVGAAVAAATGWAAITGRANHLLAAGSPGYHVAVLQASLALTLLTVMVLAAEVARRRREEELARHAELERARTEQAALRMAEAERHAISQDTHDIVGHGLAAMLLQLGAARQLLRHDPEQAEELLGSAEGIGREACRDLEIALSTLGQEPATTPGRGLAQLPGLIAALSKAGLRVRLDADPSLPKLPTLVDWSAYRILREALTNVTRHAPDADTVVNLHATDHELVLSVVDDGGPTGARAERREGRGIMGMRERATALGGTLTAWPRTDRGFAVEARLPIGRG